MKTPGPDHPITIEPTTQRVRVTFAGRVVADSKHALTLKEASYPGVQYIPRADVDASFLRRSDHHTHCPYKGDASYYDVVVDGREGKNAIWTYEDPYPAVAQIRDHIAFYPDRVDAIELVSD